MEDSIIKHVDHEKQPHLVDQLAALQQLYRATKASEYLIRSEDGPQICTKHSHLSPFDDQLGSGSVANRIVSVTQLQAAIRCILLALKDLHAATFAHTNIWWPNVMKCRNTMVCLGDLETLQKLNANGYYKAWPLPCLNREDLDQRQVQSRVTLGICGATADRTWAVTP